MLCQFAFSQTVPINGNEICARISTTSRAKLQTVEKVLKSKLASPVARDCYLMQWYTALCRFLVHKPVIQSHGAQFMWKTQVDPAGEGVPETETCFVKT